MKDPAVMAKLQAKLADMEGADSGYIESLPAEVSRRLKALKRLQAAAVQVEVAFHQKIAALEHEFAAQFAPLHAKRAQIIAGTHEPTDAEAEWASSDEDFDDEDEEEDDEEAIAARAAERKAAKVWLGGGGGRCWPCGGRDTGVGRWGLSVV